MCLFVKWIEATSKNSTFITNKKCSLKRLYALCFFLKSFYFFWRKFCKSPAKQFLDLALNFTLLSIVSWYSIVRVMIYCKSFDGILSKIQSWCSWNSIVRKIDPLRDVDESTSWGNFYFLVRCIYFLYISWLFTLVFVGVIIFFCVAVLGTFF